MCFPSTAPFFSSDEVPSCSVSTPPLPMQASGVTAFTVCPDTHAALMFDANTKVISTVDLATGDVIVLGYDCPPDKLSPCSVFSS